MDLPAVVAQILQFQRILLFGDLIGVPFPCPLQFGAIFVQPRRSVGELPLEVVLPMLLNKD
jgi:hypothetical protein